MSQYPPDYGHGGSQPPRDPQTGVPLRPGDQEPLSPAEGHDFAAIVAEHQDAVFGYLSARLLNRSDAEDLTQETFLRFLMAGDRFDSSQMIRPYLLGIARNLLREHTRRERRRREVAWTELCLELEADMPAGETEHPAADMLPYCLDQLALHARDALAWHYRDGVPLVEIGRRQDRSEGAVKLLLFRARQTLKRCLESQWRSPGP